MLVLKNGKFNNTLRSGQSSCDLYLLDNFSISFLLNIISKF
jgi:hypothetical protein